MAIRDILGFILSIIVAGAMIWACTFDIQHLIMGELATAAGGKYKFLTILNLVNRIYYLKEILFNVNLASTNDLLYFMCN
jgi:hypothetical protein